MLLFIVNNVVALWAQTTLKGYVYDNNYSPMPFANIVLTTINSTQLVNGVVSRNDGGFSLELPD